jgi:CDGSH-type Zn-finger protein
MTDAPRIIPTENGSQMVENPPDLTLSDGTKAETGAKAFLCRCGASKKKPYCDGSHKAVGFESAPDHSRIRNTAVDYTGDVEGTNVTISYTPVLCTHAAQCQAKALSVFNPKQTPWIQPQNGTLREILEVMAACPSGALRVSTGGAAQHLTSGDVSITVEKNGPYHVTNIALDAAFNGAGASRAKYSLCRCGLSKNKPFCDGSHYDAKWED